jgi:DNA-binding NarL/FixJ family response regulator
MFQDVDSRTPETTRPLTHDGRALHALRPLVGESPNLLESMLRGGLEILSIRRVDSSCTVRARLLTRRKRALSRKEREVFERLIRGSCQKEIAYDIGVALTTVSAHVRFSLHKLGLENWEAAVLVSTALEHGTIEVAADSDSESDDILVLNVRLSEQELARLTGAERTVALFALDGCTNAQIATIRHCSPRTVANQVASAFRKLGVRCRLELIRCLASVPKVPKVELVASAVLSMGEVTCRSHGVLDQVAVAK